MSAIESIAIDGHEQVSIFRDRASGATAIIAVHDTTLGPGLGGCRMRQYPNLDDALKDALGLAEGMTYKNSLAGLNLGGGKSVLVADRAISSLAREALFLRFGRFVEAMGGNYITAEDMGTSVADMEVVRRVTEHVSGRDPATGGGGDPSPWTALGVFDSIKACLEYVYGSADVAGRTVALQGVGHVGEYLAKHLAQAGAKLILTDSRADHLHSIATSLGAKAVEPDKIYSVECDVFAPCAVSHVLNQRTIPQLKCRIVAGAANIQLETPADEDALVAAGILYAPDFVINSGGVILCADEREPGGFTESRVRQRVGQIYHTLGRVLAEARRTNDLPGRAAIRLAKQRIEQARSVS